MDMDINIDMDMGIDMGIYMGRDKSTRKFTWMGT
jgi:hypothetical protein